jgi:type II secretory pathway predicted ATPase ExeA
MNGLRRTNSEGISWPSVGPRFLPPIERIMDESPFGLRERPFLSAPLPAAYFPTESLDLALRQLERCIERAEGVGLVVGAAGTGKSLLLQLLAEQFESEFHVALLASTGVGTRRSLLQNILFELNLPYRGLDEGELRLSLTDYVQPSRECPNGMLLLIDETHTLPLRLLEEIRLLTNLVRDGVPRIRLVLAGSPLLEERFTSPKLASFSQRLAVRTYLHAFNAAETANYVRHELARCGSKDDGLFSSDALRAVHVATDGIPRLVNQVCDHALVLAASKKRRVIDGAVIQEAWAELQQLPAPWNEPTSAATANATSSIEFGALEEATSVEFGSDDECEELEVAEAGEITLSSDLRPEPPVPSAAELFGNDFTEEEVIIDRFAAIDPQVLADRPQVATAVGQAFAREVQPIVEEPTQPAIKLANLPPSEEVIPSSKAKKAVKSGPLALQVAAARNRQSNESHKVEALAPVEELPTIFDPALDPVYPEQDAEWNVRSEVADEAARPTATEAKIVLIDEAHADPPASHAKGPGSGLRFRDLLSSLRRGKP